MDFNQTALDPIAAIFTLIMCGILLFGRREYILIPFVLVACLITSNQRIVLFTMDFPLLRIVILAGIFRIYTRGEITSFKFIDIDKIMIYFMLIKLISYTILWASFGAVVYMLGQCVDILGTYFFIRLAINDFEEYDIAIKTLIIVSIPIAIFMLYEQNSGGRNLFSIFGGVREWSEIRQGKLRSQGPFDHSIMAGTFGALLLPMSWGIWHRKKKFFALIGLACSFFIVLASSSSGPIVTFVLGIFGIFFWRFNKHTKRVRNLFFLLLLFLHIVMKAPVWYLIGRIDIVGGSTGFHRTMLINEAIHQYYTWILFGIRDTSVWGIGLGDVTNQYILEGARGGIITMILFIVIIAKCFKLIGTSRTAVHENVQIQKYIWSIGVILFAHTITFISISYFGQMTFFYYMHIAMISSLSNLPTVRNAASLQ